MSKIITNGWEAERLQADEALMFGTPKERLDFYLKEYLSGKKPTGAHAH